MKTRTFMVATAATFALAAPAAADHGIVVITDPTPNGAFTGPYVISEDDPATAEDEYREGTQDGHVAVYEDGVVACNGNPEYEPVDQDGDGHADPVQGYVWIGAGYAATGDRNFATPGDEVGAGSNHGKLSGEPTGKPPCPEADRGSDGED